MREGRDVVFFFGYVQLSPEERKYSSRNSDGAAKLAEINGMEDETLAHHGGCLISAL